MPIKNVRHPSGRFLKSEFQFTQSEMIILNYIFFIVSLRDSPYCISSTNENVIATGDEGGVVRLFDIRKKNPIDELLIDDGRCDDGINSIYQSTDGKYLLVASGDGTLSTYNCKRRIFLMETLVTLRTYFAIFNRV